MTLLDWTVVAAYMLGLIFYGAYRSRQQKDLDDYYLAGRKIKWWQSGFSTMATQLSAISFVSAPAFVAMKEGGGLKWLCYEFGVPIGLLIVMIIIIPVLHRGRHISVYGYLEKRFDGTTRTVVSILFQLGRGLATAVAVLAGGLIISTALPVTTAQAIIILGVITIIYDMLGGIRIVILSDFFPMIIIGLGVIICGGVALSMVGWEGAWQTLSPDRFEILDFSKFGLTPEGKYSFWPMLLGGIFLYASYYGCDQSQVQRELAVGTVSDVKKSLLFNAFGRFPIVLLYCFMGVFVGAVFAGREFLPQIASGFGITTEALGDILKNDPDRMVPMFVLTFLPAGIVGFIFVAIISALMSSLDSAINSLSAVTVVDFYKKYYRKEASDKHYLLMSKLFTVFWGIFCVVAALIFASAGESTKQTTIVLINAVGSLIYGPILAVFLMGMLSKKIKSFDVKLGIISGIVLNIVLWQFTSVSWLWWNVAGFLGTVIFAYISAILGFGKISLVPANLMFEGIQKEKKWLPVYISVIIYFLLIIGISFLIQQV